MFKEEEVDIEDTSVGAQSRYPVMPSLVALQQMRNRLHLAYLGKKLMKWTAMATGKELRRLAHSMNMAMKTYSDDVKNAYILLARARYFYPKLNDMVLENVRSKAACLAHFDHRTMTGVKVLSMELYDRGFDPNEHLGIGTGGSAITEAKKAWKELLRMMIFMLQEKCAFRNLYIANKNATKKQNVLSKIVIPKVHNAIIYIKTELEEQEREETFRLKRFKLKTMQKRSAKAKLNEKPPKDIDKEPEKVIIQEPNIIIKPQPKMQDKLADINETDIVQLNDEISKDNETTKLAQRKLRSELSEIMNSTENFEIEIKQYILKGLDASLKALFKTKLDKKSEDICSCCNSIPELDEDSGQLICPICNLTAEATDTLEVEKINIKPCQVCLPEVSESKQRKKHLMSHINQLMKIMKLYKNRSIAPANKKDIINETLENHRYPLPCSCPNQTVTGVIRADDETIASRDIFGTRRQISISSYSYPSTQQAIELCPCDSVYQIDESNLYEKPLFSGLAQHPEESCPCGLTQQAEDLKVNISSNGLKGQYPCDPPLLAGETYLNETLQQADALCRCEPAQQETTYVSNLNESVQRSENSCYCNPTDISEKTFLCEQALLTEHWRLCEFPSQLSVPCRLEHHLSRNSLLEKIDNGPIIPYLSFATRSVTSAYRCPSLRSAIFKTYFNDIPKSRGPSSLTYSPCPSEMKTHIVKNSEPYLKQISGSNLQSINGSITGQSQVAAPLAKASAVCFKSTPSYQNSSQGPSDQTPNNSDNPYNKNSAAYFSYLPQDSSPFISYSRDACPLSSNTSNMTSDAPNNSNNSGNTNNFQSFNLTAEHYMPISNTRDGKPDPSGKDKATSTTGTSTAESTAIGTILYGCITVSSITREENLYGVHGMTDTDGSIQFYRDSETFVTPVLQQFLQYTREDNLGQCAYEATNKTSQSDTLTEVSRRVVTLVSDGSSTYFSGPNGNFVSSLKPDCTSVSQTCRPLDTVSTLSPSINAIAPIFHDYNLIMSQYNTSYGSYSQESRSCGKNSTPGLCNAITTDSECCVVIYSQYLGSNEPSTREGRSVPCCAYQSDSTREANLTTSVPNRFAIIYSADHESVEPFTREGKPGPSGVFDTDNRSSVSDTKAPVSRECVIIISIDFESVKRYIRENPGGSDRDFDLANAITAVCSDLAYILNHGTPDASCSRECRSALCGLHDLTSDSSNGCGINFTRGHESDKANTGEANAELCGAHYAPCKNGPSSVKAFFTDGYVISFSQGQQPVVSSSQKEKSKPCDSPDTPGKQDLSNETNYFPDGYVVTFPQAQKLLTSCSREETNNAIVTFPNGYVLSFSQVPQSTVSCTREGKPETCHDSINLSKSIVSFPTGYVVTFSRGQQSVPPSICEGIPGSFKFHDSSTTILSTNAIVYFPDGYVVNFSKSQQSVTPNMCETVPGSCCFPDSSSSNVPADAIISFPNGYVLTFSQGNGPEISNNPGPGFHNSPNIVTFPDGYVVTLCERHHSVISYTPIADSSPCGGNNNVSKREARYSGGYVITFDQGHPSVIPFTCEGKPGPCNTSRGLGAADPYTREGKPGPCGFQQSPTISGSSNSISIFPDGYVITFCEDHQSVVSYTPIADSSPCGGNNISQREARYSGGYVITFEQGRPSVIPFTSERKPGPCNTIRAEPYTREGKPGPCGFQQSPTISGSSNSISFFPDGYVITFCAEHQSVVSYTPMPDSSPCGGNSLSQREARYSGGYVITFEQGHPSVIPFTCERKPGPCNTTKGPRRDEPYTREGKPGPCGFQQSPTISGSSNSISIFPDGYVITFCEDHQSVVSYTPIPDSSPCGGKNVSQREARYSGGYVITFEQGHPSVIPFTCEKKPGPCNTTKGPGRAEPYTREGKPGPCGFQQSPTVSGSSNTISTFPDGYVITFCEDYQSVVSYTPIADPSPSGGKNVSKREARYSGGYVITFDQGHPSAIPFTSEGKPGPCNTSRGRGAADPYTREGKPGPCGFQQSPTISGSSNSISIFPDGYVITFCADHQSVVSYTPMPDSSPCGGNSLSQREARYSGGYVITFEQGRPSVFPFTSERKPGPCNTTRAEPYTREGKPGPCGFQQSPTISGSSNSISIFPDGYVITFCADHQSVVSYTPMPDSSPCGGNSLSQREARYSGGYVITFEQGHPSVIPFTCEGKPGPCNATKGLRRAEPYTREGKPGPCGFQQSPTVSGSSNTISTFPDGYVITFCEDHQSVVSYTPMADSSPCGGKNVSKREARYSGGYVITFDQGYPSVIPFTYEGNPGPCNTSRGLGAADPYTREGKPGPCGFQQSPTISGSSNSISIYPDGYVITFCEDHQSVVSYTPMADSSPCGGNNVSKREARYSGGYVITFDQGHPSVIPFTCEGKPGPCDATKSLRRADPYTREGKPGPCGFQQSPTLSGSSNSISIFPDGYVITFCEDHQSVVSYAPVVDSSSSGGNNVSKREARYSGGYVITFDHGHPSFIPLTCEGKPGPCGVFDRTSSSTCKTASFPGGYIITLSQGHRAVDPYSPENKTGPCGVFGATDTTGPSNKIVSFPGGYILSFTRGHESYTCEGKPGPCAFPDSANTPSISKAVTLIPDGYIVIFSNGQETEDPYTREGHPGPCGYSGLSSTPAGLSNAIPTTPDGYVIIFSQDNEPNETYTREGKPGPCGFSENTRPSSKSLIIAPISREIGTILSQGHTANKPYTREGKPGPCGFEESHAVSQSNAIASISNDYVIIFSLDYEAVEPYTPEGQTCAKDTTPINVNCGSMEPNTREGKPGPCGFDKPTSFKDTATYVTTVPQKTTPYTREGSPGPCGFLDTNTFQNTHVNPTSQQITPYTREGISGPCGIYEATVLRDIATYVTAVPQHQQIAPYTREGFPGPCGVFEANIPKEIATYITAIPQQRAPYTREGFPGPCGTLETNTAKDVSTYVTAVPQQTIPYTREGYSGPCGVFEAPISKDATTYVTAVPKQISSYTREGFPGPCGMFEANIPRNFTTYISTVTPFKREGKPRPRAFNEPANQGSPQPQDTDTYVTAVPKRSGTSTSHTWQERPGPCDNITDPTDVTAPISNNIGPVSLIYILCQSKVQNSSSGKISTASFSDSYTLPVSAHCLVVRSEPSVPTDGPLKSPYCYVTCGSSCGSRRTTPKPPPSSGTKSCCVKSTSFTLPCRAKSPVKSPTKSSAKSPAICSKCASDKSTTSQNSKGEEIAYIESRNEEVTIISEYRNPDGTIRREEEITTTTTQKKYPKKPDDEDTDNDQNNTERVCCCSSNTQQMDHSVQTSREKVKKGCNPCKLSKSDIIKLNTDIKPAPKVTCCMSVPQVKNVLGNHPAGSKFDIVVSKSSTSAPCKSESLKQGCSDKPSNSSGPKCNCADKQGQNNKVKETNSAPKCNCAERLPPKGVLKASSASKASCTDKSSTKSVSTVCCNRPEDTDSGKKCSCSEKAPNTPVRPICANRQSDTDSGPKCKCGEQPPPSKSSSKCSCSNKAPSKKSVSKASSTDRSFAKKSESRGSNTEKPSLKSANRSKDGDSAKSCGCSEKAPNKPVRPICANTQSTDSGPQCSCAEESPTSACSCSGDNLIAKPDCPVCANRLEDTDSGPKCSCAEKAATGPVCANRTSDTASGPKCTCAETSPPKTEPSCSCGEKSPSKSELTCTCGEKAPPASEPKCTCAEKSTPKKSESTCCSADKPPSKKSVSTCSCAEKPAPKKSVSVCSCGDKSGSKKSVSLHSCLEKPPKNVVSMCNYGVKYPTMGYSTTCCVEKASAKSSGPVCAHLPTDPKSTKETRSTNSSQVCSCAGSTAEKPAGPVCANRTSDTASGPKCSCAGSATDKPAGPVCANRTSDTASGPKCSCAGSATDKPAGPVCANRTSDTASGPKCSCAGSATDQQAGPVCANRTSDTASGPKCSCAGSTTDKPAGPVCANRTSDTASGPKCSCAEILPPKKSESTCSCGEKSAKKSVSMCSCGDKSAPKPALKSGSTCSCAEKSPPKPPLKSGSTCSCGDKSSQKPALKSGSTCSCADKSAAKPPPKSGSTCSCADKSAAKPPPKSGSTCSCADKSAAKPPPKSGSTCSCADKSAAKPPPKSGSTCSCADKSAAKPPPKSGSTCSCADKSAAKPPPKSGSTCSCGDKSAPKPPPKSGSTCSCADKSGPKPPPKSGSTCSCADKSPPKKSGSTCTCAQKSSPKPPPKKSASSSCCSSRSLPKPPPKTSASTCSCSSKPAAKKSALKSCCAKDATDPGYANKQTGTSSGPRCDCATSPSDETLDNNENVCVKLIQQSTKSSGGCKGGSTVTTRDVAVTCCKHATTIDSAQSNKPKQSCCAQKETQKPAAPAACPSCSSDKLKKPKTESAPCSKQANSRSVSVSKVPPSQSKDGKTPDSYAIRIITKVPKSRCCEDKDESDTSLIGNVIDALKKILLQPPPTQPTNKNICKTCYSPLSNTNTTATTESGSYPGMTSCKKCQDQSESESEKDYCCTSYGTDSQSPSTTSIGVDVAGSPPYCQKRCLSKKDSGTSGKNTCCAGGTTQIKTVSCPHNTKSECCQNKKPSSRVAQPRPCIKDTATATRLTNSCDVRQIKKGSIKHACAPNNEPRDCSCSNTGVQSDNQKQKCCGAEKSLSKSR